MTIDSLIKRFQNADFNIRLDSYEVAGKDHAVDGKAPKRSELETMLADLKTVHTALVPEHNALLRKKAVATLYTKTVRNYIENQKKRERDRQYQERKRTQQKKKDTLE